MKAEYINNMKIDSTYSNVIVKKENTDYDADFEVQNDNSSNIQDECDENSLKIKKEIVKNEEEEIDITETKLQASCYSPYPKLEMKDDLGDDNLDIYKKVKTESQHNDLCSNVDQCVGEFPENCYVDEKRDISEVTLLSTENNQDEKPRIFESKQSISERLQQEEKISFDSNKICCDKAFTAKKIRDDHIVRNHKEKISLRKSKIHTCTICLYKTLFISKLNRHIDLRHIKQNMNCDICDISFKTKRLRDDHVSNNHKDIISLIKTKTHTCTMCLYQTAFKSNLNKHIDIVHNKLKIKCDFCDKSFCSKLVRDNHVLKNHKDNIGLIKSKIHSCTICSFQTTLKPFLNTHVDSVHKKQKVNCNFCDKSFCTKRVCDNHVLKSHEDKISLIKSKIYTCTICPYHTTLKSRFNMHIDSVHNKLKINCDYCDNSFCTKIVCDDHVLQNHKDKTTLIKSKIHTCTICSFQTTFKFKLKRHINSIHNKQKINCEFCHKLFRTKIILDDHVLKNHKDNISLITSKIHTCTICSFQTTFKFRLKMHIDSVHNEQKTNCDFCEKAFSTKRIRDEHVLKNHKDKINSIKSKIRACTICPYQTTSVFDLNRHINLIHNKQKIHCNFCDKSFSKKTTRDDHVLNSHKDKVSVVKSKIYSCTICPYQTIMNCYLNRHNNSIHNKQKINCDFCDRSFSKKIIREEHVLKNHKDKISSLKSNIYSCSICPFQTTSNYFLNSHINSIHKKQKINCDFCDISFSKKIIRDDHVIKNHKDNISSIKGKIHTCTICSFQTTIKYKLNSHINSILKKQKINCDFCDRSFSKKKIREEHVLKNHKDKISSLKSNIYSCSICPFQTTSNYFLNRHINSIHKKQKINCDFCDMSFSKKIIRDDHVIKNHKDNISSIKGKIHTCTICSFQTTIKSKLSRHVDSIHMETKNKL